MVSSHKDSCPWRTRQCDGTTHLCLTFILPYILAGLPESIYRVPIKGSGVMAREIRDTAIALTPLVKGVILKHPLVRAILDVM